ncbi:MAG: ABC transporter ATP-binding protein [Ginsengibacter sp.]
MYHENRFVIETNDLEFGFSNKNIILKNINLKVERGSIYGFLGPNGAGKTTTIRLLLGLLRDRNNSIFLFGKNLLQNRIECLSKIGALIEQPSLYEHLTGYDNLEITRQLRRLPKERIDDVLQTVRLSEAAHKKVKAYSLGMKQRLGIALALLAEPELLILDEPVNGLDPGGMMETRELLKAINKKYNTTIFLSSHLISEVEKIVTHVGIINMGEMLFQGTIDNLYNLQKKELKVHINVDNVIAAVDLLNTYYNVVDDEGSLGIIIHSKEEVNQIMHLLMAGNIKIYEAVIDSKNLEQLFLSMTANYTVS